MLVRQPCLRGYVEHKSMSQLAPGADIQLHDADGFTAIMLAARENRPNAVAMCELLLQFGARINEGIDTDRNPLFFAAAHGNTELILALTRAGAIGGRCVCAALKLKLA